MDTQVRMEGQRVLTPKVFISYSWSSVEHEEWVINLATRLMENGVEVKLDKWDLKEGQDVYAFMESMVSSTEIDRVLVICDKIYKEKAENRGEGLAQKLKSFPRKFIEMLTILLRNLFHRPEYRKPFLGVPPSYLFEEQLSYSKIININKQIKDAANRNPQRLPGLINEFIESLFIILEDFRIDDVEIETPLDEIIMGKIHDTLPIRDEFILFLEFICLYQNNFDADILISFYEEIFNFTQPSRNQNRYHEVQFDHYKFFIQELFLYTIMVLLKKQNYNVIETILNNKYFIRDRYNEGLRGIDYVVFRRYIRSLDEQRKNRLKSNRISITADKLIERTSLRKYNKQLLVQTDLLFFYISCLLKKEGLWFPTTYIFGIYEKVEILQRMQSRRFFERIKGLFNVNTKDEFIDKINDININIYRGYERSWESIPEITCHINPESICSLP